MNGPFRIYRLLSSKLAKPLLESRVFKNASSRKEILERNPPQKKRPRIWFHAASVGELEMLTPIIQRWKSEIVITIFSESAEKALSTLRDSLGAELIFAGYSPWEGEWRRALEIFNPDLFVSARYEAWPELWNSLGELKIPLQIVGAQARNSLRTARRVVQSLGGTLPQFEFCAIEESDVSELKADFPEAHVRVTGDPRWERVAERAAKGNPRARVLVARFSEASRPWGVLGSLWPSDLKFLKKDFFQGLGAVWIVPHQVDSESLQEFEAILKSWKQSYIRTTDMTSLDAKQFILVNELGFLSELYASADWAYVGGGFESGIHNTIEPAIHGIPVACGPKRIERFPEVAFLKQHGQIKVLNSEKSLHQWKQELVSGDILALKEVWKSQASEKLGASERVLTCIHDVLALGKP